MTINHRAATDHVHYHSSVAIRPPSNATGDKVAGIANGCEQGLQVDVCHCAWPAKLALNVPEAQGSSTKRAASFSPKHILEARL